MGSAQTNEAVSTNAELDDEPDYQKYPNARIAYAEMKDVYSIENTREERINTKASTFITVILAVTALYIPLLPLGELREFFAKQPLDNTEKWLAIAGLTALVFTVIILFIAFHFLLKAYDVKGYNHAAVDDLLNMANSNKVPDNEIYCGLVGHYHKILRGTIDVDGNMKINNKSAIFVKRGMRLTVIGFVLLTASSVLLRIVIT